MRIYIIKILNNTLIKIKTVKLHPQNVNIVFQILILDGDFQLSDMLTNVKNLRL